MELKKKKKMTPCFILQLTFLGSPRGISPKVFVLKSLFFSFVPFSPNDIFHLHFLFPEYVLIFIMLAKSLFPSLDVAPFCFYLVLTVLRGFLPQKRKASLPVSGVHAEWPLFLKSAESIVCMPFLSRKTH